MNLFRSSSALALSCVVLAINIDTRRPFETSNVLARSLAHPIQKSLHEKRDLKPEDLLTLVSCPPEAGKPREPFGYLENCLEAVKGLLEPKKHKEDWGCGNCFLFVNNVKTGNASVYSSNVTVQAIQDFIRLGIGAGYTNCTLSSGPTPPPTDLQPDGDNELYVYFAVGKPHNSTKCRKPKKHLKSGEGSA